jgi:hypothetical protein
MIKKFLCKDGFLFNLTKPYNNFVEGEYYDFEVKDIDGVILYFSMDCDYINSEENFSKLFVTIEEQRDKKIDTLLSNEIN